MVYIGSLSSKSCSKPLTMNTFYLFVNIKVSVADFWLFSVAFYCIFDSNLLALKASMKDFSFESRLTMLLIEDYCFVSRPITLRPELTDFAN